MGELEEKQQVPPLRFAPVGMTIWFQLEDCARINKVTASQGDESVGAEENILNKLALRTWSRLAIRYWPVPLCAAAVVWPLVSASAWSMIW